MTDDDRKFLIDCITTELVEIVMTREQLDLQTALGKILNSKTYNLLCDPETALAWQSPNYIYETYKKLN